MKLNITARNVKGPKPDPNKSLTLKDEKLIEVDFSGKELTHFTAVNCEFRNCKFERLKVDQSIKFGSGLIQSTYIDCSFDGSMFRADVPGNARFINCTFREVNIKSLLAFTLEFINCIFSGKLNKAVFSGTLDQYDAPKLKRKINEFYGNDFSHLKMNDVDFRDCIDLSKQKLPMTDDYLYIEHQAAEIIKEAYEIIAGWSDEKLKKKALIELSLYKETVENGQKQFFLIKADLVPGLFSLIKKLTNK